jgi:hypothetical protein
MKRTTKTMIAGAAVAGLFSGAFATQAHAALSTNSGSTGSTATALINPGSMLVNLADSDTGKHDCKGMNSCKGQGGCKTSDNGCKGKNDCKGKGGCKTNTPS